MRRDQLALLAGFILILLSVTVFRATSQYENRGYTLYMRDYDFVPREITAPAGAKIKLTLVNKGEQPHEVAFMLAGKEASPPFTLGDENNVTWELELAPGAEQTITYQVPDQPGEYQMVCGIPGHLEHGMQGTLFVR
jgi:uncharacterized cupredoxin-like copper-binding protein